MQNILKQFGARATVSFSERFHRSIVRLTLVYSCTLAIILLISGFISYSIFSTRVGHRFHPVDTVIIDIDQPFVPINTSIPTPAQLQHDLVEVILTVNISLLILAVFLSYWLARQTLAPIKEAYEEQQRFLSDASHELRTPLAILQLDLENEMHSNTKDATASKLEEVRRMSKLVNDILAVSRMDSARVVSTTVLELQPFIQAITDRLQSLANKMQVTLTMHPTTLSVHTDGDLLSHILTNIVQNALIYNKEGGTVDISCTENKDTIRIVVADTGIGIDAHDLGKVFDRFYRADKSRTRETGGSGLGLAIVQSAVEQLRGSIQVESELGKGTTLTVTIPR